jgi:ABC-type multidrug transport system ATPase subunit
LALGIGFSKELSGIDNIYLNGMLLGFTKKQIAAVLDEIVSYSELNEFIHRAMKTYSSGMISRLGFSVAIHLRPEVLLIDEVLSVGDAQFREKSFNSIHKIIRDKDTTVVIVSHSMGQLEAICDNVIWLEKGRVITQGNRLEVLDLYSQYNQGKLCLEDIVTNIGSVTIEDSGGFLVDAKNYSVRMPGSLERYFLNTPVDYVKEYTSAAGNLRLTKRQLFNKDYFLYFEYVGQSSVLSILTDKVLNVARYDHLYQKPPFDNRYWENKLTGFYAYLDLAVGSVIVSKVYYYKRLIHKHGDGESIVYEFIRESDAVSLNENSVMNVSLDCNTKDSVLFYILVSKDKIFRDMDNLGRYLEYYYKALYNNSVWNSFFTSPEGTFTKLPYSIEPFTKDGYGYSLHHSSRKDLIPFYNQTKERFFEDFILNAVFQAYLYQPRENGMFLTAYTSTWLKKDIGFTAPYIDTRLNETFILMLQDFQTASLYFHELEPIRDYADFFCGMIQPKREWHTWRLLR